MNNSVDFEEQFFGLPYRIVLDDGVSCWFTLSATEGGHWMAGYCDEQGRYLRGMYHRGRTVQEAVAPLFHIRDSARRNDEAWVANLMGQ
jgi:hypothetical protein